MSGPRDALNLPQDGGMVRLAGDHARRANIGLNLALEHAGATGEWPTGTRVRVHILSHIRETGFGLPPTPGERAFHMETEHADLGRIEYGFCIFHDQPALPPEREMEKLRTLITDAQAGDDCTDARVCSFRATDEFDRIYAWRTTTPGGRHE